MKFKLFLLTALFFIASMHLHAQRTRIRNNLNGLILRLNDSLKKYDEMQRTVYLLSDSVFSVKNKDGSFVTVNVLKLQSSQNDSFHRGGIDFIPVDYDTHAPANWIHFQQTDKTVRLKFVKASEAAAKRLYYLFINLRWYMQALRR